MISRAQLIDFKGVVLLIEDSSTEFTKQLTETYVELLTRHEEEAESDSG